MSKTEFILEASPRKDVGKGASRRLRRLEDLIPAVIYGDEKEPTSITLKHNEFAHAIENEAFFSQILTIKIGKTEESVVIKDLQRHPSRPVLIHADFLRVSANKPIHVRVPIHFINEEECIGVKLDGGQINHLLTELEISCLPKDLPEFIQVFMAELKLGESIHIADLALPEGVTSVDLTHGEENNLAIAAVNAIKIKAEEEESSDEAADGDDAEAAAEDSAE